jgi:hypothetical protein
VSLVVRPKIGLDDVVFCQPSEIRFKIVLCDVLRIPAVRGIRRDIVSLRHRELKQRRIPVTGPNFVKFCVKLCHEAVIIRTCQ